MGLFIGLSTVSQLKCLQICILSPDTVEGVMMGGEGAGNKQLMVPLEAPGVVKPCIPGRVAPARGNEPDSSESFNNLPFIQTFLWTTCLLNVYVAESFEVLKAVSKDTCFLRLCPVYLRQLRSYQSRKTLPLL